MTHGDKLLRIQVKYRANGTIPYKNSWTDKHGTHENKIDTRKIDYFALVNEDYSIVCYPLSTMAGNSISYSIPNSPTPYNWYADYLDFKVEIQPKHITTDFSNRKVAIQEYKPKIQWPSIEEMQKLVYEKPTAQLAKDLRSFRCSYWKIL